LIHQGLLAFSLAILYILCIYSPWFCKMTLTFFTHFSRYHLFSPRLLSIVTKRKGGRRLCRCPPFSFIYPKKVSARRLCRRAAVRGVSGPTGVVFPQENTKNISPIITFVINNFFYRLSLALKRLFSCFTQKAKRDIPFSHHVEAI